MRRLLSKPRRVLLRLLGVKRRRRYNNKNKYVAMLLNHDKQLKTLNKKCFTVPMFDMFLKAGHKELEDKINAMAKANMSQALECRIGELEDRFELEREALNKFYYKVEDKIKAKDITSNYCSKCDSELMIYCENSECNK